MSFQFTCPSRSTTSDACRKREDPRVSIHVPLAEHDSSVIPDFAISSVSIHVPLAEHDAVTADNIDSKVVSIHVPLAEHDTS